MSTTAQSHRQSGISSRTGLRHLADKGNLKWHHNEDGEHNQQCIAAHHGEAGGQQGSGTTLWHEQAYLDRRGEVGADP
eukprot:2358036-Amphidinium_carterae.2